MAWPTRTKSKEAWKEWRDDSVKAIKDQIAALDDLAKTEDREKQDQEELRKIAKLRVEGGAQRRLAAIREHSEHAAA